ncbi:MAG: discoidin domain-containing protein, partial [Gemmatimonadales bacterium]
MSQTQSLPVTVHNPGTQPIQVALDAIVSNSGWTVKPSHQVVTVEAGKDAQVPFAVDLPPDAAAGDAVQVAVRASSASGIASATTKLYALCAATPANPKEYSALPPTMLGGLNVASGSLGAHPVEANVNLITRQMMLYDGMTPSDAGWSGDRQLQSADSALTLTVALAGSRSARLTGVTLIPGNGNPYEQIDQFDILVSDDGQTYQKVLSGRLRTARMEQAFAFPAPVQARFARLHIVTNQGGKMGSRSVLGEFKVIDAPGEIPLDSAFNLADPRVGGHVVWSQPLFSNLNASLTAAADAPLEKLDPSSPNEWVVGFNENRAAQISRLEWVQPSQQVLTGKLLTAVDVSVSTESPVGPWTSVGSWKISATPGTMTPLLLPQPAWARFVRFSTTEPKKANEYWRRAETIRIFERPADASYRSILAEWGHYARTGIYEQLVKPPVVSDAGEVTGNGKRDDAKKIESGKSYRGIVALQRDEDWYRIDIPSGQNRLKVNLQGDPTVRAVASLQDESGKTIPSESSPGMAGITRVDALVEGGKTYYLKLVEPPRSIALVFDNSSSIRNYTVAIFRALGRFVQAVQPKMEFANVLPLMNKPKFLLENWSDQPYVLQAALQQYDQSDASSNSERGLLAATEAVERREGSSKAILLLTDAATDGYASTSDLWAAFGRVLPRVFTLELQLGNQVQLQQHLMQDWSSANAGHYSSFKTIQDLDMSFDRMSCYLRRPVRYTLTFETRFEEAPAPGGLEVTMAAEAVADNAVEIILDASGSMLQMLGGRRKMDIARSTLVELVEKTLPDKTPFAFRAFGTRIANCESDLLLNVQPLDRAKVGAMVRGLNATNLAKTPLGASLLAVGQDLKNVKGQKVVVLLTDGEETCGGDPGQAIQTLKTQGLDLRINVVGFDVADAGLKVNFERWATLGGGRYFDAKNGQELTKAMTDALRPKFQVTDVTGGVVAEGNVGGGRVSLPVGTYTVRVLTSPVKTFE